MEKKLIGFKRFESKTKKKICIAYVGMPFNRDRVTDGSAAGCEVDMLFMPEKQYDYLQESDVGKEVETDYDIVGRQAYLRNLTVIRGKEGKG